MRKFGQVLALSQSAFSLSAGILGPAYVLFAEEVGGSPLDIAWAYGIFKITSGLTVRRISKFEDNISRKKLMLITGYLLMCIGYLGYLYVDSGLQLVLIQIMLGFAQAIALPLFHHFYAKSIDDDHTVSGWGQLESGQLIMTGLLGIFGGTVIRYLDFTVLFWVMFSASVAGFFNSLRLLWMKD